MTLAQEHPFLAGFSPPNSSPENGSFLYEDDSKDLYDFEDTKDGKPKKYNGRKGPGPVAADRRATHNAIERARRESLNGRFLTLAEALPSMASVKRPSKSIIVNKALDFVFEAQVKEHALIKENNELRQQVDQLRARLGMSPLPPPAPLLPESIAPTSSSPTFSQSPPSASLPMTIPTMTAHAQQQQQQQPSPNSIFSSPLAVADSPASTTSNSGSVDLAATMEALSPYPMTSMAPQQPTTPLGAAPSPVSPYPFAAAAAHQVALFGYFGNPATAGLGGVVNPAGLLSQQQQLLFAHLQHQHAQQQQQQHAGLAGLESAYTNPYTPLQPQFYTM